MENIGMIKVGEMFSSNDDGFYYFMLTPYDNKKINYIDFYGQLQNSYPSIPIGVRPCLYISKDIITYEGNGTIDKPYLLKSKEK